MAREALGRPYWVVLLASSVSMLGDGIKFGAVPLLAASPTKDPRLVSLVDVAVQSGWLLLGLVARGDVCRGRTGRCRHRPPDRRAGADGTSSSCG